MVKSGNTDSIWFAILWQSVLQSLGITLLFSSLIIDKRKRHYFLGYSALLPTDRPTPTLS